MGRTIAAVATPPGLGGIAVLRVSGDEAIKICDKIFRGGASLEKAKTHTIHYGFIYDLSGKKIDEVLVSVMRAPKTFTREDVVEISTHGGTVCVNKALEAVIAAGAELAEAGEFTKRAFLNGRIDLSQAEAVVDIINSTNTLSQRTALSQLEGTLSKKINDIRSELVRLAASMQVIIDYPDEDLADVTEEEIYKIICECKKKTSELLATADSGKIIRDGIKTAIAGKPNVGKSSLLNALAGTDRAIVTNIAGTTRDVIEEYVSLDGIQLVLTDTAGIRETDDEIERLGVERSRKSIDEADLVLAVFDGSDGLSDEDKEILEKTSDKNRIIIINKSDLNKRDMLDIPENETVICTSAVTGDGLSELADEIKRIYKLGQIESGNGAVITNIRHKKALNNAYKALENAAEALNGGMPSDIASIDINEAISCLGEITGETVSESIVGEIFHNFCVGK